MDQRHTPPPDASLSLRTRIAPILAAILLVASSGLLVYLQLRAVERDWAARQLALAERVHDNLSLWIDERVRDSYVLSRSPSVHALLGSPDAEPNLSTHLRRLDDFAQGYEYSGIYVVDRQGKVVGQSTDAAAFAPGTPAATAVAEPRPGIRILAHEEISGAIHFVAPVLDDRGDELGQVEVTADPRQAFRPFLGPATAGLSGRRIYLVRRAGGQILALEPLPQTGKTDGWRPVAAGAATTLEAAMQGGRQRYSGEGIGMRGAPVFAGAVPLEHVEWSVLCEEDERVALAEFYALARLEGATGLLLGLGLIVLAYSWRRGVLVHQLNQRMMELTARARLAAVVDSTTDAILGVDKAGRFVTWNPAAERLFGYRSEEVLGKSPTFLAPPELREEPKEIVDKALRGVASTLDTVRLHKSGRQIDVNLTVSPVFGPEGDIVGTAAILRDISARKQAEEELRRSHAALERKASFEALLGSVSSSLINPPSGQSDEAIDTALRRIGEHFGFDYARIHLADDGGGEVRAAYGWVRGDQPMLPVGTPVGALAAAAYARLLAGESFFVSDPKQAPSEMAAIVALGRPQGYGSVALISLTAAGESLGALHLAERSHPIEFTDERKRQLTLLAQVFANVLSRLRRERDVERANADLERRVHERTEELAASERGWQQLFDDAPDSMVLIDIDGAMRRVNMRLQIALGYRAEQLIGRDAGILFCANEPDTTFAGYGERSPLASHEVTVQKADGTTFPASMRLSLITSPAGELLMASFRNTTEEKRLAAELRAAARLKDEFLASMSHELRTPLTAILGFAESLLLGTYGSLQPRQEQALESIQGSGGHLLALINDVLDLSKIEAGRMALVLAPCHVFELCRGVVDLIAPLASAKNLALRFSVTPEDCTVLADERRLRQMLLNLLSNAVKFTEPGGTAELNASVDAEARRIRFVVVDTGIGIAASDLPNLFQIFTQLDRRLSRSHEGTGMGLAIVRRMAELHNGCVEVESEIGKGSRFTLTLPWEPPSPNTAPSETNG